MAEGEASDLPMWNWTHLSGRVIHSELDELAAWVADLQQAYGRWVRLPPCWPCHRALREELAVFWYWRQRLDTAADAAAEEAVRWHQSLRASAEAWTEAFGGCRHQSIGEIDENRDARDAILAISSPFLEAVKSELSPRTADNDQLEEQPEMTITT